MVIEIEKPILIHPRCLECVRAPQKHILISQCVGASNLTAGINRV
jgi:hypothetical protein